MQISIFGISFKGTRHMFTWEKFKCSIFLYWAQFWRGSLLGLSVLLIGVFLLLIPAFFNFDLPQHQSLELNVAMLQKMVYSLEYWYQDWFVLGIILLCLLFACLMLGALYIQYYTIFKKNYRSFSRHFDNPEVPSLWNRGFWKAFILVTVLTFLMGLIIGGGVGFILESLQVHEVIIKLVSFIIGLAIFHTILHGGVWGFVPAALEVKSTGEQVKC